MERLSKPQAMRISQYAVRKFTELALKDEEFELTVPALDDITVEPSEEGLNVMLEFLPLKASGQVGYTVTTNYREYGPTDGSGGENTWDEEEIDLCIIVNGEVKPEQLYQHPIKINLLDMTISFNGIDKIERELEDVEEIDDINENHYGYDETDFDLRSIRMHEVKIDDVAKLYPFTVDLPEYLVMTED